MNYSVKNNQMLKLKNSLNELDEKIIKSSKTIEHLKELIKEPKSVFKIRPSNWINMGLVLFGISCLMDFFSEGITYGLWKYEPSFTYKIIDISVFSALLISKIFVKDKVLIGERILDKETKQYEKELVKLSNFQKDKEKKSLEYEKEIDNLLFDFKNNNLLFKDFDEKLHFDILYKYNEYSEMKMNLEFITNSLSDSDSNLKNNLKKYIFKSHNLNLNIFNDIKNVIQIGEENNNSETALLLLTYSNKIQVVKFLFEKVIDLDTNNNLNLIEDGDFELDTLITFIEDLEDISKKLIAYNEKIVKQAKAEVIYKLIEKENNPVEFLENNSDFKFEVPKLNEIKKLEKIPHMEVNYLEDLVLLSQPNNIYKYTNYIEDLTNIPSKKIISDFIVNLKNISELQSPNLKNDFKFIYIDMKSTLEYLDVLEKELDNFSDYDKFAYNLILLNKDIELIAELNKKLEIIFEENRKYLKEFAENQKIEIKNTLKILDSV